ncbi:MAG: 6-carboxytetrahydropterin synthase [Methanomicrobia archaeon]|nr:6-carboxytetrahydropterin synthase [Methanomicrobia archaeon]
MLGYPTSENIALFLQSELEQRLLGSKLGVSLHSVRVWEANDKWVLVER